MAVGRTRSIDTPPKGSVFWRPSDPSIARRTNPAEEHLGDVAVGSDHPLLGRPNRSPGQVVQGYPIQLAKVQRPPLRAATLRRQRLIGWLDDHASRRVIFVSAEAGYGKTTLLADWARHARVRVLWYRIDEDDGNWVAFAHYLVAAGRELDPTFAPRTTELLGAPPGDVTHEAVAAALVAELPSLASAGRVVFVLDDYHLVDHVAEIRELMKLIVGRAPSGMSFLLAGRRIPSVPVSRLRTMGEVAELRSEDLRFQLGETAKLFSETYGKHLEADVIDDVNRRTEGWAASLQLVSAAVRDRSPAETRAFVGSLTGARGDLHDYLAEEVVADLAPGIQSFLMRTSILQIVDSELASVVTDLPLDQVAQLISTTEALGLLGRRGQHEPEGHRYHPLVREFLEARFRAADGTDAVVAAHRKVARATEETDWRVSAHHWAVAGNTTDLHRLLVSNAASIMATGEFASAAAYVDGIHIDASSPVFDLFISRIELDEGRTESALSRAASAHSLLTATHDDLRYLALSNLASINLALGHLELAYELFTQLAGSDAPANLREIGRATLTMLNASIGGPLDDYQASLSEMETRQRRDGRTHYLAITLLNGGVLAQTRGDPRTAADKSREAISLLQTGPRGGELTTAIINHAWSLAHIGQWDEAQSEVLSALGEAEGLALAEGLVEAADLWTWYGDRATAMRLVGQARDAQPSARLIRDSLPLTQVELQCRNGNVREARQLLDSLPEVRISTTVGHTARRRYLEARLSVLEAHADAKRIATEARDFCTRQQADFYVGCLDVVLAAAQPTDQFQTSIAVIAMREPVYLTLVSDLVGNRLHELSEETFEMIGAEAARRPSRWRDSTLQLLHRTNPNAPRAALILEQVGTATDIPILRQTARSLRGRGVSARLGRRLAHRLAPRILIEDQGRVRIRIGDNLVADDDVRRKVLAVICFLITRPSLSAARDEVIDAVWPDVDPSSAANSLNQTLYFLRRVLEPRYQEDLSANYVHHDSDVIWLDETLIDSRSRMCRRLIDQFADLGNDTSVTALAREYKEAFALDFAYEEWAVGYRTMLHAAYLDTIEKATVSKLKMGQPAHAIALLRKALHVDRDAEQLERLLLRAYHEASSHAAVGEQYAHYAAYLRDELGVEPPTLQDLIADGFNLQ